MSYLDICILGWNLNALMFCVNFLFAAKTISSQDKETLAQQSSVLKELKLELEKYLPYRTLSTILTYTVPFTAFFRMNFRFIEMFLFFKKNPNTKVFDYMVYKYTRDINKAKNRG